MLISHQLQGGVALLEGFQQAFSLVVFLVGLLAPFFATQWHKPVIYFLTFVTGVEQTTSSEYNGADGVCDLKSDVEIPNFQIPSWKC